MARGEIAQIFRVGKSDSLCSAAPPRCEILAPTPCGRVAAGGHSPLRRLRRRYFRHIVTPDLIRGPASFRRGAKGALGTALPVAGERPRRATPIAWYRGRGRAGRSSAGPSTWTRGAGTLAFIVIARSAATRRSRALWCRSGLLPLLLAMTKQRSAPLKKMNLAKTYG